MSKSKIINALKITIDDVDEDLLLDILIDAYKAQEVRIRQLEQENTYERELMHFEREQVRKEYKKMRLDPLYCATGQYFFVTEDKRKFGVTIQGATISMFERRHDIDFVMNRSEQFTL